MDASGNKDLTSIMSQVENLQKQLAAQANELRETREKEETARQQVEQLSVVNSKLTEAKREAMKQDFNNVVQGWIRSMDPKQVPDELKDEFLNGVEKFVDKGNESGIWKVRRRVVISFLFHILTSHTGGLLRIQRTPESGQHHPEAHGRLQRAQEDDGGRAISGGGLAQAKGDGAGDGRCDAGRVGAAGGAVQVILENV
jgi:hypothetical protein